MHKCEKCGDSFDTKQGLHTHRGLVHTPPWQDKERLQELYHEQGLSTDDIADKFNTRQKTILTKMDELGIERRTARNDPMKPPIHKFERTSEQVGNEYEMVISTVDYDVKTALIHRLIAVANGQLHPSDFCNWNLVVHHESRHGLDNRPDNLAVKERGQHARDHLENGDTM